MPNEMEMDNLLVQQKDRLIALINRGQTQSAIDALFVIRAMWEACGYGYKVREMESRIGQEYQRYLDSVSK